MYFETIHISSAKGLALDWVIAQLVHVDLSNEQLGQMVCTYGSLQRRHGGSFAPTTEWGHGGAIADAHDIDVTADKNGYVASCRGHFQVRGPTRLVAAMRCLAFMRLGEDIEVPEELVDLEAVHSAA